MLKEFKKFAMRGNVLDMAVGIIIGAAFGTVVKSLVDDVIMPPIGALIGGIDFSALSLKINETTAINYGNFINNIITFLIVAFAVFLLVKGVNSFTEKEDEAPKAPPPEVQLLTEIRDALQKSKA